MKKILCYLVIVLMLLGSVGCQTATSYPQFDFGDFELYDSKDYLEKSYFSYLRCGDCAFIPQMRAITHEEYAVDFWIYTNSTDMIVSINSVEVVCDSSPVTATLDSSVDWEKTEDGTFRGTVRVMTIPMESVDFQDGDSIKIGLSVSVKKNEVTHDSVLLFDGVVWRYKTVVFPV